MTCPYCTHCREVAGGPYRCCEHCIEDQIHDVPKDGHDLPCDVLGGCQGRTKSDANEATS